jgi:hypothetical protein
MLTSFALLAFNARNRPTIVQEAIGSWLRALVLGCLICALQIAEPLWGQSPVPLPSRPEQVIPGRPATNTSLKHLSQQDQAKIILSNALLSGVWGQSAHCLIRHEIETGDRQLRGTGKYARGSIGEMKLVLTLVAGDFQNRLEQVSDGRRLRMVHRIDGKEEGSHVDLVKVSEYLGNFNRERDMQDPLVALHLSIGGQNEKLRALCQQYKWTSVKADKFRQPGHDDDDVDIWWMEGERLKDLSQAVIRGTAKIDGMLAAADDVHLAPNRIKIAIGRGSPIPYWLYYVEETRMSTGDKPRAEMTIRIDYHDPTPAEMPAGIFNSEDFVSSSGTDIDETPKYQPPLRPPI